MAKRLGLLVLLLAVAVLAGQAAAAGDTATTKPSKLSPELKVLHRFVGNWKGATKWWTPEEFRWPVATSCESILGGRFTLTKAMASNGNVFISVSTYDKTFSEYRKWSFGWRGVGQEAKGKWDDKTGTMTWRSDLGRSGTSVETFRYLEDNSVEWSLVTRDRSNDVLLEMSGKYARAKQPSKPKNKPMRLSKEDRVLDMFLGGWKTVSTTPKNSLDIQAGTWTSTSSCVRAFGGPFLLETTRDSDGETALNVRTYDVRKECYRAWWFSSEGYSRDHTLAWDAKTRTLMGATTTASMTATGTVPVWGVTVHKLRR